MTHRRHSPRYTNKNIDRKQQHQLIQDFTWKMTDVLEEYNISPEIFLELIHKYITTTLVKLIKEK